MPKRTCESKEEKFQRKLKKYEEKLESCRRKRSRRVILSSDEEDAQNNDERLDYEIQLPILPAEELYESVDTGPLISDTDMHIPANPQPPVSPVPPASPKAPNESNSEVNEATLDIDPDILKALGDHEADEIEWGEDLHDDIAKRYQHILVNGLKKENKEELLKKHLFSQNVKFSKSPTLNPEISAMLSDACKNRDKRILLKQDQLGRALSSLGLAMTALLKKNPNIVEVMRILNDVGKLIADSHYTETDTRRSLIIPLVDKSLIEPFKDRKRDSLLFGEKLSDLVKNSRGLKKTGQYIQATASSSGTSGLNWRGPPPARGRQQRSSQPYSSRGVGLRSQYPRGRRAPPPPPPPARRQANAPPPPPPPARRPPPAPAHAARPLPDHRPNG